MTIADPYKTLGVDRKASDDDVKKAYRNLAKKFHPDKNKSSDAEERFKEIGAAYDLLKDSEKRRIYDMQRAGDEERAENARRPQRSTSTPRPESGHRNHFTSTENPSGARTFTFRFATFDDSDDDFVKFFYSDNGREQKQSGKSRNKNKSRQGHTKAGSGTRRSPRERPGWDEKWTEDAPRADKLFSDFDTIFGKQISDMNQLISDLMGESPLFRFRGSHGALDDDFLFSSLGGRVRGPSTRPRKASLADMWDWSVPMFRRRKNDPFACFEDSDEDEMTDIRFPCIYCGKELSSSCLNAHEEVCKRFHGKKPNPDTFSYQSSSHNQSRDEHHGSKPETPDDARRQWGGTSSNHQKFRENKENQKTGSPPKASEATAPKEEGHVICPWCEREFNRSIALRHIMACERLASSSSQRPSGSFERHTASNAENKSYHNRQMGDSAAAKKPAAAAAAERSSTKAKPEHSQTPRRASKATSRTPHHESSSRQPSGRKFMDEPFVTSGTGLHTPRTGQAAYNSQSKPKRPSAAREFGPGIQGKNVHFANDYSRCSCYGGWLRHSRTDAEMESTSSDSLPSSEYSDEQCLREGATGGTQVSDYPTYKANDDLNSAFDATLWGSKKCLSHHVTDNWNKVFCSCGTAECTCGQFSRDLPPGDWFRRMFYPRWSCF